MNPNDYTSAFAGLPDPSASFMQGVQNGAGLQQLQAQQQQQQQAALAQQQMHSDLADLSQNPTTQGIAAMSIKYPQLSENFKRSWDMLAPEQQQSRLSHATQVYAALQNGAPDVADKLLTEQAAAARNSGNDQDAKAAETMAALIKAHPEFAKTTAGLMISSAMGPDKFTSTFAGMGAEQRAQDEEPTKQREAGAKAGAAEADAYAKNLSVVGQTLGSLQGKSVKPEQAQAALKSLAARGIISKDELPGYLAAVPSDPKQLNDWLGSMKLAGMKPDEQMKFTTPDANTTANNETSRANTASNNATQLKVQDRIDARQESKGSAEANLDADTLSTMAAQYLAGDKSVMQNLGRGAQGSANIVALRQEITKQAKQQGMSGPAIAAAMADYVGTLAGQRTAGTRIANVEMASDEAQRLIPLAQQASADVARSGFLPFGKAQNMFDDQTNNPALRKFAAANNALVNVYSRAISPGGVATVSDKEHARHMLSTAMDHKSYLAVLDQMQREIQAAREAPQAVRGAFRDRVTGGAPAASGIPAGWSVKEH